MHVKASGPLVSVVPNSTTSPSPITVLVTIKTEFLFSPKKILFLYYLRYSLGFYPEKSTLWESWPSAVTCLLCNIIFSYNHNVGYNFLCYEFFFTCLRWNLLFAYQHHHSCCHPLRSFDIIFTDNFSSSS